MLEMDDKTTYDQMRSRLVAYERSSQRIFLVALVSKERPQSTRSIKDLSPWKLIGFMTEKGKAEEKVRKEKVKEMDQKEKVEEKDMEDLDADAEKEKVADAEKEEAKAEKEKEIR